MLVKRSVFKTVLTLFVSATMALPAPSIAQSSLPQSLPAAMEGESVLLVDGSDVEGRRISLALAIIDEVLANKTFADAAVKHEENFYMMFGGPNDPTLKAVEKTGKLAKIKAFFASGLENTNKIFESAREKLERTHGKVLETRENIKAKIKALTERAYSLRKPIMGAVAYAGVNGGYVFGVSGNAWYGTGVLLGILSVSIFTMFNPKLWSKICNIPGDGIRAGMEALYNIFGVKMSDVSRYGWQMFGQFLVPLAINSVQAYFVNYLTGDFTGLSMETMLALSAYYGFFSNWNIWDGIMADKIGKSLTQQGFETYMFRSLTAGAGLEVWNISGAPGSEIGAGILLTAVVTGIAYNWLAPIVEPKYGEHLRKKAESVRMFTKAGIEVTFKLSSEKNMLRRGAYNVKTSYSNVTQKCAAMLAQPATSHTRPTLNASYWDDMQ